MLRNKKTGEVVDGYVIVAIKSETDPSTIMHDNTVGSVAKLNEKWEDYKPAEPLIKDEKIRKAVRAWAKANSQRTRVTYHRLDGTHSCINFIDFGGSIIEFNKTIDGLTCGKIYNFEELCGEEEE